MRLLQSSAAVLPGFVLLACATAPRVPAPLPVAAAPARADEIAQVREIRPDPESPDDLICRRETRVGSHFPVRICNTRAEIEAQRRESQEAVRDLQRSVGAGPEESRSSQSPQR